MDESNNEIEITEVAVVVDTIQFGQIRQATTPGPLAAAPGCSQPTAVTRSRHLDLDPENGSPVVVAKKRRMNSHGKQVWAELKRMLNPVKENEGPLYPANEYSDSLVLYQPSNSSDSYDKICNPNGIVPVVVVNPYFTHGLESNAADPTGRKEHVLTPVQIEGLKFMWASIHTKDKKGCILAHEMGLGKTFTTIALIWTLLEQSEESRGKSTPSIRKAIIVTPKGIGEIWSAEFSKWRPPSKKLILIEMIDSRTKDGSLKVRAFEKNDKNVLILSYDNWKKYKPDLVCFESQIPLVICDEAHTLKNEDTQKCKALRSKLQGEFTGILSDKNLVKVFIGLTGTPYQNNEEQICNLVEFFRPGTLPADFKNKLLKPIRLAENVKNTKKSEDEKQRILDAAQDARATIHTLIKPVIQARRNDFKVDKHEVIVCVGMDTEAPGDPQGQHTDPTQDPAGGEIEPEADECATLQHDLYKSLTQEFSNSKLPFYSKIDLLKKLCIHPIQAFDSLAAKPSTFFGNLTAQYSERIKALRDEPDYPLYSAKFELLVKMLTYLKLHHKEQKVLVVSYSLELLKMIVKFCESFEDLGHCLLYEGDLTERQRTQLIDRFESDGEARILLLSGKSGATGLDLSAANHLFLMDPDWNPANDKQVIGRIYRTNQRNHCYVYRFLTTNTIEEVIFMNQLSKIEMEEYFEGDDPQAIHGNGYDPNDLVKIHEAEHSFIKSKLKDMKENEDLDVQEFATELDEASHYAGREDVPEALDVLKNNWEHGITYSIHKIKCASSAGGNSVLDENFDNI